jgi:hypothetical protein
LQFQNIQLLKFITCKKLATNTSLNTCLANVTSLYVTPFALRCSSDRSVPLRARFELFSSAHNSTRLPMFHIVFRSPVLSMSSLPTLYLHFSMFIKLQGLPKCSKASFAQNKPISKFITLCELFNCFYKLKSFILQEISSCFTIPVQLNTFSIKVHRRTSLSSYLLQFIDTKRLLSLTLAVVGLFYVTFGWNYSELLTLGHFYSLFRTLVGLQWVWKLIFYGRVHCICFRLLDLGSIPWSYWIIITNTWTRRPKLCTRVFLFCVETSNIFKVTNILRIGSNINALILHLTKNTFYSLLCWHEFCFQILQIF